MRAGYAGTAVWGLPGPQKYVKECYGFTAIILHIFGVKVGFREIQEDSGSRLGLEARVSRATLGPQKDSNIV